MKIARKILPALLIAGCFLFAAIDSYGWGFWGHREITRNAITLLPKVMASFFLHHHDYIVEHSVDPDLLRKEDSLEQFNHYLDLDYYGSYPFQGLPKDYDEAAKKFSADTIRTYGLLPWKIAEFTELLSDAMRAGDEKQILHYATFLAHYVEDSYVPLHACLNYDGQLTNQKGIHSRFESEIPERYGKKYQHTFSDKVTVIPDPREFAFGTLLDSFTLVDSILVADLRARDLVGVENLYLPSSNGSNRSKKMSQHYFGEFSKLLGGIPQRRIEGASVAVARFWYTAWVNAGKPTLPVNRID